MVNMNYSLKIRWSGFLIVLALASAVWPGLCKGQVMKEEKNIQAASQQSCEFPKDDAALKKMLSPEQYRIVRENGTERPFQNAYWDNHEAGIYVDVVSGEPLFSSIDKFDSGTGWPSFSRPIDAGSLKSQADRSHGMERNEVRSSRADSHLGHVFDDGPGPDGQRFCINSGALRFVPVAEMEKQGYGQLLGLFGQALKKPAKETATLAAGCFWGAEETLRKLPGVIRTTVGYTGGKTENPTEDDIYYHETGHAEVVEIEFDPAQISYERLLEVFWEMHDPTTLNRQGPDWGTQYRSAVFFHSPEQEKAARASKQRLEASGRYKKPIVTEIVPAATFYPAEDYHQRYLEKRGGGSCHVK